MQKCQVGIERLRDAHTKVTGLEAEKRDLQAALEAKNQQLQDEYRYVSLVANLDTAVAEGNKLKAEMEIQEKLTADLIVILEK